MVTGATGRVGRDVIGGLRSLGCMVVGMARDPATALAVLPGLSPRIADYDDIVSLKRALTGVDQLVFVSSDGDANSVVRHHANVIESAVASGIRHIVFTSIIDCDAASPFYFASVYDDTERRLLASGIGSTILRCGLYSDFIVEHWLKPSEAAGEMMLPAGPARVAPISRKDVAAAIAAVAACPARTHGRYTITGPDGLSFHEIAAIYETVIARPLRYRPCSQEDYVRSVSDRLPEPWPVAFATLCAAIEEGRWNSVSQDFKNITSREAESFYDFLIRTKGSDGLAVAALRL